MTQFSETRSPVRNELSEVTFTLPHVEEEERKTTIIPYVRNPSEETFIEEYDSSDDDSENITMSDNIGGDKYRLQLY